MAREVKEIRLMTLDTKARAESKDRASRERARTSPPRREAPRYSPDRYRPRDYDYREPHGRMYYEERWSSPKRYNYGRYERPSWSPNGRYPQGRQWSPRDQSPSGRFIPSRYDGGYDASRRGRSPERRGNRENLEFQPKRGGKKNQERPPLSKRKEFQNVEKPKVTFKGQCWRCGKDGHFYRECPHPEVKARENSTQEN